MFPYTLVRSRRKTVAIHITKDAAVEVRAPVAMSKTDIDKFVESKERWIASNLERRVKLNDEKAAFRLFYGDMLLLRGREHPIRAKYGNLAGFDGEQFYLPPGLLPDDIKHAIVQIYRALAKQIIGVKTSEYTRRMSLKPAAVKINGAKTCWGSCSGKNSLNFSWRLIMADDDVIDYVIVHELAHIREHNHSARFWEIVEDVLPDAGPRRQKLKTLQERLAREDWE